MVSSEDIIEIAREAGISQEAIRKVIESDRENELAEHEIDLAVKAKVKVQYCVITEYND